jgi:hypothetical protein
MSASSKGVRRCPTQGYMVAASDYYSDFVN